MTSVGHHSVLYYNIYNYNTLFSVPNGLSIKLYNTASSYIQVAVSYSLRIKENKIVGGQRSKVSNPVFSFDDDPTGFVFFCVSVYVFSQYNT